ncbi:four-carbon acid sugar kinase family protein [Lampropedia puyangensis]|uniref:Four-carbon acid sugar kinase family protein n=1 Tax=Lampropedia puyangensis TaxID=1330072 RepID=A0A4S8F858_9BURK|nr:four-carbon acid sugar kinase family protein [Lampropedia puyangensis]THU01542.1 four-carbon acid sugar kinase family protein [Lampropedia puyangensis]
MAIPTLIIADDLTGAADCAASFVVHAADCVLWLSQPEAQAHPTRTATDGVDVVVVDTDSRRLHPAVAAKTMLATLSQYGQGRAVFKKMDSTLRGHWATEVAALQPQLGLALIAPAFPAMGRLVRGGHVWVHGVALAETDTWQLEHADCDARPQAMLQAAGLQAERVALDWFDAQEGQYTDKQARAVQALRTHVRAAQKRGCHALVFDCESDAHLAVLVQAVQGLRDFFWVGSGGLAQALAAQRYALQPNNEVGQPQPPLSTTAEMMGLAPLKTVRQAILTVVGSMSAVAKAQVDSMQRSCGCAVHRITAAQLYAFNVSGAHESVVPEPASMHEHPDWLCAIAQDVRLGVDPVVTIASDDQSDPVQGPQLARRLAQALAGLMPEVAALVLTGGETARAVLQPLGIARLNVLAQVEPGVVLSRGAGAHAPLIITKAGAFGDAQSLSRAYVALRQHLQGAMSVATPADAASIDV